ncbi:MAG: plasmid stabilization protein [Nocardia sp.]|uniref:type II toxin-antitoxin system RelE family toxin n=1 Tax=Nocardia sp. TaxID=1821 RepID=UPI00261CDFDA|nr:type II toxin-antitoxin system RelE/ParE family toxin [Nocardia sp.]MCU1642734.1 plasmid stabilization protein [Nocardia sp.]
MKYGFEFLPSAARALRAIPQTQALRILTELSKLGDDPYSTTADVRKLVRREDYRLRVGDYRLIYRIEDGRLVVLVVQVGHRREIYDR